MDDKNPYETTRLCNQPLSLSQGASRVTNWRMHSDRALLATMVPHIGGSQLLITYPFRSPGFTTWFI